MNTNMKHVSKDSQPKMKYYLGNWIAFGKLNYSNVVSYDNVYTQTTN